MNMYTPYRDKMCQKCGKKPYIMFVFNPSNDIAIDPINEYLCVDCAPSEFFTNVKPDLEDKYQDEPVDRLFKELTHLQQQVNELTSENKKLKTLCKDLLDCDRCQCGKCLYCEAYEALRTYP